MEKTELLNKPIWQMTGAELLTLLSATNKGVGTSSKEVTRVTCTGVHELAEHLKCCDSTIYMLKRNGILDDAIISRIGKKIVFDVNEAREAAAIFQDEQHARRCGTE